METRNQQDLTLIFSVDAEGRFISFNKAFSRWARSSGKTVRMGDFWADLATDEETNAQLRDLAQSTPGAPIDGPPKEFWHSVFGHEILDIEYLPFAGSSSKGGLTVVVYLPLAIYNKDELFHISNDLFSISNFDNYFLELNEQWVRVLGYTKQELKSQPFLHFLHPEDLEETQKEAETLYGGKRQTVSFKNRYRTKSGSYVWLEWNSVIDYERRLTYSVARDITEQQELDAQLRQSEERYRSVVESLHEGIVVHDMNDRIMMCNESAAKILGLTVDQLMGRDSFDPRWKALDANDEPLDPSQHPTVVTVRTGEPVTDFLMNVHIGNEHRRIITINSNPIINDDGEMYGVVASFLDVTEEQTAQHNLRDALAMKTLLFRELHHRIKNNLNLISNLMYLKSEATNDPSLRHFVSETNSRILSIAKIHEQLLEMEEANQLYTCEYLEDLIKTLVRTYASREDLYEIDFDVENHKLDVDRILVMGLITNEILSNTLKHAYDQEVGGKVRVSLHKQGDNISYVLGDQGKGLTSQEKKAKSIGMDLIQMFCKQLGGKIEQDLSHGVTYTITFPASKQSKKV